MNPDRGEPQAGEWKHASKAAFPSTEGQLLLRGLPDLLASVIRQVKTGQSKTIAAENPELLAPTGTIGQDLAQLEAEQGWGSKAVTSLPTFSNS